MTIYVKNRNDATSGKVVGFLSSKEVFFLVFSDESVYNI
jgi:hypothetical protein